MLALFASALLAALSPSMNAAEDVHVDHLRIDAIRIGFKGTYKLGCWTPFTVKVVGGFARGACEVTTQDPDGVPTTYSESLEVANKGGDTEFQFFIRVGQENAPLIVRLIDDAGNVRASRTFLPRPDAAAGALPVGLPATNKLLVTLGLEKPLDDLARDQQSDASAADALRIVNLMSAEDLPTAWQGYEGVDALILGAAASAFDGLVADDPRIAALREWIELGGQLVVFTGETAPQLIGADGPLAPLLPGRFAGEFAQVADLTSLEVFSGADSEVTLGVRRLRVPELVDVAGQILAAGPANLPLVARQRRGIGEVTFIAVDPDVEPIVSWNGRAGLLRHALQWTSAATQLAQSRRAAAPIGDDLINQLRSALDRQLAGVTIAPFALVAALVLAYVALIGPGDFFLLKKLRRPPLTWLTFPLIVVATSAAAYWLAYRLKGSELRVNQLEVVDVDVATGHARGSVWTHVLSPRIERYDLALEPHFGAQSLQSAVAPSPLGRGQGEGAPNGGSNHTIQPPASTLQPPLVAWLGSPGYGLGGMRGQRGLASNFDQGYEFDAELATMHGLPIEQWSTKSLAARWTAHLDASLEADLRPRNDDLVAGRITNRTGVPLDDAVLMHRRWAVKLPPLAPNASVDVDGSLTEVTIRTVLTSIAAGDDPSVRPAADGSVIFDPAGRDVARIAKTMMFYEAIGGAAYTRTLHRYQAFIDMSRLLHGDQAILLARAPAAAGSQWIDGASTDPAGKPLARPLASDADRRWVYYRFIIPLASDEPATQQPGPVVGPAPSTLPGPSPNP